MAARQTRARRIQDEYEIVGGFAEVSHDKGKPKADFIGPAWITSQLNNLY